MTTAKQVPAMVAAHQEALQTEAYAAFMGGFLRSAASSIRSEVVDHRWTDDPLFLAVAGLNWVTEAAQYLNISQLFHVSESMMHVAIAASETFPEDTIWGLDVLPCPTGFLVFEQPMHLADVWGRQMGFAAVSWYRSQFSDRNNKWGTTISYYSDILDPEDVYNQARRDQNKIDGRDMPLGRWEMSHAASFMDGDTVGPFTWEDTAVKNYRKKSEDKNPQLPLDVYRPTANNPGHTMLAIYALMDQTVTVLSEETDRRLQRRNRTKKRPPPMVTVITLRRKEEHGYHEEGTGRWLTYRSVTRGHWRKQPYKDGSIKRIWINPYVRGPENAPWHKPARVSTLVR